MARPRNVARSVEIRISVLPAVRDSLEKIAESGLYGRNKTAVAERFVSEGIERVVKEQILSKMAKELS